MCRLQNFEKQLACYTGKTLCLSFDINFGTITFIRVPLSSTQTPSVQHISSTFGPHLFSPKNPSVPHQKPLSSTPTQFNTKNPSVPHKKALYKRALQLLFFGVELRGF